MTEPAFHSTAELRRANRNRVFRCLYTAAGPMTKQDLARALSMSLPTLTQNLNELLSLGLIDNSEIADSTGGRKPRILSVVPGARYAVGAELSPHHVRMAAVDLRVRELDFQVIERPFQSSEAYARGLAQDLETFLDRNGLDREKLLGVGLTLPGILNLEKTVIETAPTLGIKGMDVSVISRRIPYRTRIANDATSGGFAEWWNRTDIGSMAYLSVGRGVGGAILIDGVPYGGAHQRAAEFGHMCIHPGGRLCSCGKRGCLEACCSTARISDDLGLSLEAFFSGLTAGRAELLRLWEAYLDDLAVGISNLHVALDCEIVLGGTLSQFLEEWYEVLERRLMALDPFSQGERFLHLCRYHAHSNSIGAALYFVDEFFNAI